MEANKMKITETVNENSRDIDQKPVVEILKIINNEDKQVALAVEKALPENLRGRGTVGRNRQNRRADILHRRWNQWQARDRRRGGVSAHLRGSA